jgi:hypothetical protein
MRFNKQIEPYIRNYIINVVNLIHINKSNKNTKPKDFGEDCSVGIWLVDSDIGICVLIFPGLMRCIFFYILSNMQGVIHQNIL